MEAVFQAFFALFAVVAAAAFALYVLAWVKFTAAFATRAVSCAWSVCGANAVGRFECVSIAPGDDRRMADPVLRLFRAAEDHGG